MTDEEFKSEFVAEPPQWHFLESKAKVRGYGGAMGGGKSRTMCEAAFSYAMEYPGIQILMVRHRHTAIIETTRKTMFRFTLKGLPDGFYRTKSSMGEDWVEFFNGSRINFVGLDDPEKWYSSEIGCLIVDEAHQVAEADVVQLMSRIRQPCSDCADNPVFGDDGAVVPCTHYPHNTMIAFNPASPNHWLNRWFVKEATKTEFGYWKDELWVKDAVKPKGSCEFVFANAYANPYVSREYIEQELESLPELQRRRLLLGEWVLTAGSGFFDAEALTEYEHGLKTPWKQGTTTGDVAGNNKDDPIRVDMQRSGPLAVWKAPVRGDRPHRYIVSVDVSSGGAADFTGIQVLDVEEYEQVAEVQVKTDPDLAAVEAFRLACIYNGAHIVIETTGGWGFTATQTIDRKLLPYYKGPRSTKPSLYTRRGFDRLKKEWTDRLGWDTNSATRAPMLDELETAIRERTLRLYGSRTLAELQSFIRDERDRPGAESGENDDLVIALAMAVYVRNQQPAQLKRVRYDQYEAVVSTTGY